MHEYFVILSRPTLLLNYRPKRSTANGSAMFRILEAPPTRVRRKNAAPEAVASSSLFYATPPRVTLRVFVIMHHDQCVLGRV